MESNSYEFFYYLLDYTKKKKKCQQKKPIQIDSWHSAALYVRHHRWIAT